MAGMSVKRLLVARRKDSQERLKLYERQHRTLAAELARVGYIWPGTLQRRMMACGKSVCACHHDAAARHGPYPYWTSKVGNRTVSRLLTSLEADLYEEWISNRRKLEDIRKRMTALSKKVAPIVLKQRLSDQHRSRK